MRKHTMHNKRHPASDVASLSKHRTVLAGDKSSKGYSSCSDHSDDEDNLAVAISASPRKQAKCDVLPPKRKLTIAMSESDEDTDDDGNNSTDQRGWQHCPLQRSDSFTVVEHWECQPQTTNKLNWSWLINLLNELSITQNDDNIPSFARSNECWSQYGTVTMLTIATTSVGLFVNRQEQWQQSHRMRRSSFLSVDCVE